MPEKITVLTPQNIWDKLFLLAQKIKSVDFSPDVIIGIIRGGLEVTRTLSDLLEIKQVTTIGVGFYKGIEETHDKPQLTQKLSFDVTNKKILLVDDVADTGRSMALAVDYLKGEEIHSLKTATIHYKPHSIFKPDFFIEETEKWIVYPWEYVEFTKLYIKKEREKERQYSEIAISLKKMGIPKRVVDDILPEK
jgi:hypoxanthine phosphoribosyltransferase